MKAPITEALLETISIPPGKRQVRVADTRLPGFGVVVGKRQTSFTVSYTTSGGRRVRGEVIGTTTSLSVRKARQRARERLAEVELGLDDPNEGAPEKTIGELLEHFLEWSEVHRKSYPVDKSRVDRHLKTKLPQSRPASSVNRQDVRRLATSIGERPCGREKGCRYDDECQGHKGQANRVIETLRRVYSLAEDDGLVSRGINPAWNLRGLLYPEKGARSERSATEDEVRALMPLILTIHNPSCRALLWTLLLTGLRRSEASYLRWADVNLTKRVKVLPGRVKLEPGWLWIPTTKAGRPHRLPISGALRDLLESLPVEGDYVFCGQDGPLRWIDNQWRRVRKKAGCPELTIHDLRATVASWVARLGYTDRTIAQILNHRVEGVTSRYVDDTPRLVIDALEDHGRHLLEVVGVKKTRQLVWPAEEKRPKIVGFSANLT